MPGGWWNEVLGGKGRKPAKLSQEDHDAAVRIYLAKVRRRLASGPNNNPTSAAEKLARKRFAKRHARGLLKRFRKGPRRLPVLAKALLVARYKPNSVLDHFLPNREKVWKPLPRRHSRGAVLTLPSLSFVDRPGETLEAIAALVKLEATEVAARVNFDFPYCEDIGPFLLLSEIWPSFAPIFTGGEITNPVSKVIEAVGIRKSLRMSFPALQDLNNVWAMPVQRRRPRGSSASEARHLEPQSREAVSDLCCDKIDEWLVEAETDCLLTDEARGSFKVVIGEILDNAERHSSVADADGSWTVAAFMARRVVDGVTRFACHLAFLSLVT